MDESQRETRKSNVLIVVITVLIIILSYITNNNYRNYASYLKKQQTLTAELLLIKNQTNEYAEKKDSLTNQLNDFNNLDETIKKTKNSVFDLASQVENKIIKKETNYKIAYITFDDGPYYSTNNVLNILKEYQVKATFFTIGQDKDTCYDNKNYSCSDTYKKIVDSGHTIANHTYSHGIFKGLYSNADSFIYQVKLQEDLIKNRTGVKTNIIRFPGGSATARALAGNQVDRILTRLKENGYGWVDWTSQDGDGGYLPNYDTAWRNFTNTIDENIEVILFHDYDKTTISMLPNAIKYLENNNYILLPLFYNSIKVNK